jgi:hypothetical protein
MPEQPITKHKLELARELLDDIELSKLSPEQILLKVMRLARLCDDTDVRTWLNYELLGYPNTEVGRKFMDLMKRWTDKEKNLGYWIPFAAVDGTIAAIKIQIQQLQIPDVHLSLSSANPHEFVTGFGGRGEELFRPASAVLFRLTDLTNKVTTLSGIRSRVLARVHSFVCTTYYELAFSGAAESIFQRHQIAIDILLRENAPEVLEKIPSISDRLAEGDSEAISQAMNSCRRMIKALADAVYPASDAPVIVDGTEYQVGSENYLNRIKLHIKKFCASESRRERLRRSLTDIHDKASAGTHDDITPGEAQAIFLSTYLLLGEVLDVSKDNERVVPAEIPNG